MVYWNLRHAHLEEVGFDVNSDIPCPRYNLWMRIEGPHNYMVTVLGSCVKWPSAPMNGEKQLLITNELIAFEK